MSTTDTYREICRLLEPYNKRGIELAPETDLGADLGVDSADAMNLVMEIEDHYEVDIPLNLLGDVQTLQQLVALVQERLENR